MEEVTFGQYAAPIIVTVILGVVYKMVDLSDRWKVALPILLGMGVGLMAIPYNSLPWTAVNIIDHLLYGLISIGASAIGLHQIQRKARQPAPEIK